MIIHLENGEYPVDEYGNTFAYSVWDFGVKAELMIKDKFGFFHYVASINKALPGSPVEVVSKEDVDALVEKFGRTASKNITKQIDENDAKYSIRPCESTGMHQ